MTFGNRPFRNVTWILGLLLIGYLPGIVSAQGRQRINRRPIVPVVEAEKVLTAERVRESLNRGVNFLKRSQLNDGSWGDFPMFPGGVTALVTLAMVNSGVPANDKSIVDALASLDRVDIDSSSVYVVSLMTMVYCYVAPDTRKARIRECAVFLANAQARDNGSGFGGWNYKPQGNSNPDSSNTQFALLALHEAATCWHRDSCCRLDSKQTLLGQPA